MMRRRRDFVRLAWTVLVLVALLAAVDALVALAARRAPGWMPDDDPREGILSDQPNRGSRVVLVGDSVFYSQFIDREDQALWRQLEVRLRVGVQPAALIGASPHDILSIARRAARHWPAHTTALIGIHPARIFGPRVVGPLPNDGPFAERFRRLDDGADLQGRAGQGVGGQSAAGQGAGGQSAGGQGSGWPTRLDDMLRASLARHSFIVRHRDWMLWSLESALKAAHRQGGEPPRDIVWTDADDAGGRDRWRALQAALADGGTARQVPFSWIEAVDDVLRAAGIRAVFVLTPLNVEMIRRDAAASVAAESVLAASHGYLLEQLRQRRAEFIDLYDGATPECFADAIHTNARGNAWMAGEIAGWLAQHPSPEERR